MMTNCPVCSKNGLPNYTVIHTICPQCNSDLKPYLLLHDISRRRMPKALSFTLGGVTIIAFVFAILYLISDSGKNQLARESSIVVSRTHDSIMKTDAVNGTSSTLTKEFSLQYKVRKGDCLSKIAQFYYNDWRKYRQIVIDNNLSTPYTLIIGQPLTIKITQ